MIELINGVENFSCVPDITLFPDLKDSKRDFQIVANSPGRSLTRSLWVYIYIYIYIFFFFLRNLVVPLDLVHVSVTQNGIEWTVQIVDLFTTLVISVSMSTSVSAMKLSNKSMYFENFYFKTNLEKICNNKNSM